jgi:hypothetical protein
MRSLKRHGTLKFQICWNPSNTTLVFKTLLLIASWIEESLQQLWPFQTRQKGCEKLISKPLFEITLWELYCSGNTCQRLRIFQFLKETSTQKKRLKTQNKFWKETWTHKL